MKFSKVNLTSGPALQAFNTEMVFRIRNEGKRKGFFQYVATIDFLERLIDGDLPIAGRNIYTMGFGTQREAKLFCETFEASGHYSYDRRKQDALNAVHDAEMARILAD